MKSGRAALLIFLAFGVLIAPLIAEGQQAGKAYRVGFLHPLSAAAIPGPVESFRRGLRELGYVEGQNIVVEYRWADAAPERLPELAADLVRLKMDVIVAPNNPAIFAAQKATTTIPIVMVIPTDPIGFRFVANLARPGGNITGLSTLAGELGAKRVQLLREAFPAVSRIGVLWEPEAGPRRELVEYESAIQGARLERQLLEVRSPAEIHRAFAAMTRTGVDAVIVRGSSLTWTYRNEVAEHAMKLRLPMMCVEVTYVEAGCLMGYGASFGERFRRAAYVVDKLLKGADPGSLPIEQSTKVDLVINLKTAKAVGLTIPSSLLLRADQVIE